MRKAVDAWFRAQAEAVDEVFRHLEEDRKALRDRGITKAVTVMDLTDSLETAVKLMSSPEQLRSFFLSALLVIADSPNIVPHELGIRFDVDTVLSAQWFADYSLVFAQQPTETTASVIRDIIHEADRKGWGVVKIQDRLSNAFGVWLGEQPRHPDLDFIQARLSPIRTEMIARTESMRGYNAAKQEYLYFSGVQEKEWLTAVDGRERDAHRAANGQRVPIDGFFQVGGDKLAWPGDPSGSPGNTINCRCTIVPIIPDEDELPPDPRPHPDPDPFEEAYVDEEGEEAFPYVPDPTLFGILEDGFIDHIRSKVAEVEGKDVRVRRMQTAVDEVLREIRGHLDAGGGLDELLNQGMLPKPPTYFTPRNFAKLAGTDADDDRMSKIFNGAHAWLSANVAESVIRKAGGLRGIEIIDGRAYYSSNAKKVVTSRGRDVFDGTETFIHEYSHHLHDHGSPNLEHAIRSFLKVRRGKSEMERIYPGMDEYAYKDRFAHPYTGRVYDWEDKKNPKGYEVFTMGMESLYRDPVEFFRKDAEHWALTYAVMKGVFD
jgi:hypothetical protein